jgi:integrase
MKRQSFQRGSVVRRSRALGPDMWVFLFREGAKHRSSNIGTVEKYPTKASAEKAANKIRKDINGRREFVYVNDLLNRYEKEGLPDRSVTSATYLSLLRRVREKWGLVRLDVLAKDLMGIEQWVNGLRTYPTKNTQSRPLSKKSKIHVKAFVHRLFERAIFWNMLDLQRNPIGLVSVKGRGGRVKPLVVVTVDQYLSLLSDPKLPEHAKIMVQIAMCLGLRASEILGLKWVDIDFEANTIRIQRSVVGSEEEDTKTPGSAQTVPAHPELLEALRVWKETPSVNGWVFGSPFSGRPYWRGIMQQDHLAPAGERAGIQGLGWHSFRHTYRTMLRESGQPMEVQQKLMRHTDIRTTMGYGDQSMTEERKAANILIFEKVRKTA